jgi:hypothetical protein
MERDLERENRMLKEKIRLLRREERFLKKLRGYDVDSLLAMLKHRHMTIFRMNPEGDLLLPPSAPGWIQDEYYSRLHHYSFRLFLRDLIKHKKDAGIHDLTRYCSPEVAAEHLRFLIEAGAVEELSPDKFCLVQPVRSFGGTLEWYICRVLKETFSSPSLYGVHFKGTRKSGDYDVLADLEGMLIYLEVKSSPPRGIEANQISAFLDRVDELIPHGAVFLNDTELRMKDKLVPIFEEELAERARRRGEAPPETVRLINEIFVFGESLYLMNSRKRIVDNLSVCLRRMIRSRGMKTGKAYL